MASLNCSFFDCIKSLTSSIEKEQEFGAQDVIYFGISQIKIGSKHTKYLVMWIIINMGIETEVD